MLWSILIAAIPERYHVAHKLLYSLLETQAVSRRPDIELLYLMDNKRRTVGSKRNVLLGAAQGEYVSFIDDDDEVAINYVQKIQAAIVDARKTNVDVICFPQRAILSPANIVHECSYSLEHKTRELKQTEAAGTFKWTGPPAHTMVWRRELVKDVRFPERQFGEDVQWVDAACEKAKKELQITGAPLYIYKFDEERTATR